MKTNLIIPGFGKCGTSSLHEYLDLHPQICMSAEKEPHYFSVTKKREMGTEWYDSLFQHAEAGVRYFGESSTTYATWEPALRRIKSEIESPKLILILRDPLQRLLSHYKWMYARGNEVLPIKEALLEEQRSIHSPDIHRNGCYPRYRRASNYSQYVPLIQNIFGEENVLLLRTDDLKDTPQAVLDKCFDYLELPPYQLDGAMVEANVTCEIRVGRNTGLGVAYREKIPLKLQSYLNPLFLKCVDLFGEVRRVAPEPKAETLKDLQSSLSADIQFYDSI